MTKKLNFLEHLQGWWNYCDAIQCTKKSTLLTPKTKLLYEQIMRLWNDNFHAEELSIWRDILRRKAVLGSKDTYSTSMKALNELGLIVYKKNGNDHSPCKVEVRRLDELYRSWKDAKSNEMFPTDFNQSLQVPTQSIQEILPAIVQGFNGGTPDNTPPKSGITQQQVDTIAPLFEEYILDKCVEMDFIKPILTNNERNKLKELIRVIGGGASDNLYQRLTDKVDVWAQAAKNDNFLKDKFHPSGLLVYINNFEKAAQKKVYPLRNNDNIPITSIEGTQFIKIENIESQEVIKNEFKKFKENKKTEKENNKNFTQYLNYHNFHFKQGAGWQRHTAPT